MSSTNGTNGTANGTVLAPALSLDQARRYARHIILPEVGSAGQRKLLAAKVLLIGAGGLGSPAALYLAAAGVGTIGIVDYDLVDLSSQNGTCINGKPLAADRAEPVSSGDVLLFGGVTCKLLNAALLYDLFK